MTTTNRIDVERAKQCCDAAAEWWANHLRAKPVLDNGGRDFESGMAMAMMSLAQDKLPPVTEDQIATFKRELSARILARLQERRHVFEVEIGSDYGVSGEIQDAGTAAGLKDMGHIGGGFRFPLKTSMVVHDTHVMVAPGYQRDWQKLIDLRTREELIDDAKKRLGAARKWLVDSQRYLEERGPGDDNRRVAGLEQAKQRFADVEAELRAMEAQQP